MKKFFILTTVLFCILLNLKSYSQCPLLVNSASYGVAGGVISANTGTTFNNIPFYSPGTYFQLPMLNGGSYAVTTCGSSSDTQLTMWDAPATNTLAYNDDNGPLCAGNAASIDNYVPNFSGYANVQVSNHNCLPSGFSSINVGVRQNNNLVFTSSNAAMCSGQIRPLSATPAKVASDPTSQAGNLGTFTGAGVSGTVFAAPTVSVPTTYTVTYTFGYVSQTQTIQVNPNPTVSASPSSTFICNGGQATFIGGGASTYTWSGGITNGVSFNPASSGSYTVTGASAAGCTNTAIASLTLNPIINTSTAVTNVLCNGNSTGSATISTTGGTPGYAYLWSTAATTSVISGLNAGVRTVIVTDAIGCTSTRTVTITQPASALTTATAVTNVSCSGGSNGSATVTTSGGTAAYIYLWSTAATTSVISGLNAGVRTVTVTDANACTSTRTVTITQPTAITSTISSSTASICSGAIANFTHNASGGTAPITYSWNTGASNATISVSPTINTTYTGTATDVNGCFISKTVSIVVNANPVLSVNSGAICDGNSFTMTPSGAATYTFSSGSAIVSPTLTSSYSVTGTSTAGCIGNTAVSTITVNSNPSITVNSGAICDGNSFTMTPSGAVTYTFSSGSAIVSPTITSSYTVIGASGAGCNGNAISSITVNANPTVTAVSNTSLICVGQSVSLTASGASTYSWSSPSSSNTVIVVSPIITTTYSVIGTDINGCSNNAVVTQNVSPCTNIESLLQNTSNDVSVYPNPSNGVFIIELSSNSKVTLVNALGEIVVHQQEMVTGKNTIDLNAFSNGIYFVKVIGSDNAYQNIKIIKQ
jgi:hypothetical protein